MITFLASPKPFNGIAKENQYRAIRSWLSSCENVEVILYGDSGGIEEAAIDLGVRVVKQINCAPSGIPYFGSIVEHAADNGKYDYQIYLNCDILLAGILPAMNRIAFQHFLLIGQRIDLSDNFFIDFSKMGWKNQLTQLVSDGNAKLHGPTGIDYFAFRRGMWLDVPSIIIGRGGYDQALLAYCMRRRIPIVDGTFVVTALHQFHDYNHMQGGENVVMGGVDANHNINVARIKRSSPVVSDADYVVKKYQVEVWSCRGDWLRRLELRLRYNRGWFTAALVLRFIWRGLNLVGLTGAQQLSIKDIMGDILNNE